MDSRTLCTSGAILHQLRGENQLAQQHAEAAIDVSTEHGLSIYEAFGIIARGSALVEEGSTEEGIEQIRHGLAVHEATGARLARPYFLALLADALRSVGKIDESLRARSEEHTSELQSRGLISYAVF